MTTLLAEMDSFDAPTRRQALAAAMHRAGPPPSPSRDVNMHVHSFFSYNGEGWSPTRIGWEARQRALHAVAICDFDVLTGLDELLEVTDLLQVRAAVGFESRTYFAEYAEHQINSPGEPGVFYFMGMGFVRPPAPASAAARVLTGMLEQSHARNRAVLARINACLPEVQLDYAADVLPMTPAGNATERHIVQAYYDKGISRFGAAAPDYWEEKLQLQAGSLAGLAADTNAMAEILRSKLMKQGGLGYELPTAATFPGLDTVIDMIRACEAIPMAAWLDGSSSGEADPQAQLECLLAKGVEAVNIIPDRNWNFSDPAIQQRKVEELNRYVTAAAQLELPINVGTELNKPGQRFVDDFAAPPLRALEPLFHHGANIIVGHTRLLRFAGVSYIGAAAASEFPTRQQRNTFFAKVGALPAPLPATRDHLQNASPAAAFACLADAAKQGRWQ